MRISDWSSDVCSSDLAQGLNPPGPDTIWQASGDKLTPATPVTLSAANDRGQRFQIRIAVDQHFMFTVQQTDANAGTAPVQVATYALVNRKGVSVDPDSWTIQLGPMAVPGRSAAYDIHFQDLDEAPARS